jgi:hypothetical protein
MDKDSAKKLIRDTFERSFDKDRFVYFIKNLLNKIDESDSTVMGGSHLPDSYKPYIESLECVGKYEDGEGNQLDVLIVLLKEKTSLERARARQRNFISWYLNGGRGGILRETSLVAFVSPEKRDWRFSFVKMDYAFVEGRGGKTKVKEEFTPSRRFSFLVGESEKSHTAQIQLLPLLEHDEENPTLAEIEALFNIEIVAKEFFDEYRGLFIKVKDELDKLVKSNLRIKREFEIKEIDTVDFSKKLLGQIVFLYFLQKKGWFGVARDAEWGSGPRNFLRLLFKKDIGDYLNFFNDILEHLFYEALDRKREDDYYGKLNCKVPFLNGGLFEPINTYNWIHTDIMFPNELFSNSTKNSKGDIGTGILDVFDRYNFTVREDEPLEKEVAVDPEMLGKVFENLLEVKDRKSKGTFYTPREIVHYMCQESLINYLEKELNIGPEPIIPNKSHQKDLFGKAEPEQVALNVMVGSEKIKRDDLESFIKFGETIVEHDLRVVKKGKETKRYPFMIPEVIRKNAKDLDDVLAKIKICDPAVGSGAFLVGMMSEIVRARNTLTVTEHLKDKLNRSPYDFKRHAIHDCLYGVDSDSGAVEICKLRLWLSLVVDEEDIKQIKPLPNLDFKIITANSLIGGMQQDWIKEKIYADLEGLKESVFDETSPERKQELKNQIDDLIKKVQDKTHGLSLENYFSEIFRTSNGFDLVIGNPPYVQIQKFSGQQTQKNWEKQYKTFTKSGDIYCLFYERGSKILRNDGTLTFITSNKWMRANYGKKMRNYFLHDVEINMLIDFGDAPIFKEATTYTNIMMFSKSKSNTQSNVWDISKSYIPGIPLADMLEKTGKGVGFFNEDSFVILQEKLGRIKNRIESVGTPIKEWGLSINYGIKTGFNEALIIDGKKKNELVAKAPESAEIIKPILRGRDIKRYQAKSSGMWMIATFPALNINIEKYPAVRDYLESFLPKLNQTGKTYKNKNGKKEKTRKKTGNKWFETQDQISYYPHFKKEKIIYAEIVFDSAFYFDINGVYPEATTFIITGKEIKYCMSSNECGPKLQISKRYLSA